MTAPASKKRTGKKEESLGARAAMKYYIGNRAWPDWPVSPSPLLVKFKEKPRV